MNTRRFISAMLALILILSSIPALADYRKLEFGDRGSAVLKLQKALDTLGFDPNGADGKYGRGTENAVKLYQASRGLEVDGKAGNLTQTSLYNELDTLSTTTTTPTTTTGTATLASTLKYGDKSDAVKNMQKMLKAIGYDPNGVDGSFGAGTQRAVISFQKACSLKTDGLVGSKTLALLTAKYQESLTGTTTTTGATTQTGSLGSRTLRKGYTGSDVTQLQGYLKDLGYYSGSLDGSYGTGTMAAVMAFQKKNKLTVDGLAGSRTITVLTSSGAIGATGGTTTETTTETTTPETITPPSTGYTTLRSGSTGSEVTKLQNRLVALGYTLSVNGTYDRETKSAVLSFQVSNNLDSDGVAGALTQAALYASSAKGPSESTQTGTGVTLTEGQGQTTGPKKSEVQLLHWFNEIKPSIRSGKYITIFDPATNLGWRLRLYSLGRHADSEPATATDTAIMFRAFGNQNTWTPKPVYVQLPDGRWTLATMHNVPHLSGSIKDNDFDGHLCVHFLRDMSECEQNDPKYGVQHQNAIRKKWKEMTGQDVAYQ